MYFLFYTQKRYKKCTKNGVGYNVSFDENQS